MGILSSGLLIISCLFLVRGEPKSPMVAFMCNKPAMYMSDNGWVEDRTTDCIEDADDILDYCKKVYPNKDITNVVEASDLVTIDDWCSFEKPKCHKHNSHTVRPYRCLVGPFQSDALLVPEHCLFDHQHGQRCARFAEWNVTATEACREHQMALQSFAMLQPCQPTNVFNGVEFVCCPHDENQPQRGQQLIDQEVAQHIVEDDSNLLEIPDDKKPILSGKTYEKTNSIFYEHYIQKTKDDHYLNEHEYFFKAKNDLQKHHHERVTKMMKEWADARQKVADMKEVDPKGAEKLNKEITARFQKSYEALEQEGMAEKSQLTAIHQQRVQSDLNDKKRAAMEHYMDSLTEPKSDATKILKALKHYVKTEEKDKLHSLNHFKHVQDADPMQAKVLKQQTKAHLDIIAQRIDQAIDMLKRVPAVEKKVRQQTEEYISTFRELDNAITSALNAPDYEVNNSFQEEPAQQEVEEEEPVNSQDTAPQQQWEEIGEGKPVESDAQLYHVPLERNQPEIDIKKIPEEDDIDEQQEDEHYIPEMAPQHQVHAGDHAQDSRLEVQVMNDPAEKHSGMKRGGAVSVMYSSPTVVGVAVAAIAVFVIIVAGVLVLRKRSHRHPRGGFVEVDQSASPEERHVANMQMNGYENPTYRYFEGNQPQQQPA